MKRLASPKSTNAHLHVRTARLRRCLSITRVTYPEIDVCVTLFRSLSTSHRPASDVTTTQQQREAAWRHFAKASRQFNKSVHERSRSTRHVEGTTTSTVSAESALVSSVLPPDDDCDEALMAMTPHIALHVSTAASNAALMCKLGVIERVEYQVAAKGSAVKEAMSSTANQEDATRDASALLNHTDSLLRVCQTGIQAQVSSFVILRHLWGPFHATPAVSQSSLGTSVGQGDEDPLFAPTMEWAVSLPGSIRALLLTHELQRLRRRQRYASRRGHTDPALATETSFYNSDKAPAYSLGEMWAQTARESRAVVLCCCAPWLLRHSTHSNPSTGGRDEASMPLCGTLYSPLERQMLEAGLQICEACHAEDVAQALMTVFIRDVDRVARDISSRSAHSSGQAEEAALVVWYTNEATSLYESAMMAAGTPRTQAVEATAFPLSTGSYGFPLAYSYLIHRGVTMATLSEVTPVNDDSKDVSTPAEPVSPSLSAGRSWSSFVTQHPRSAIRLVAALSGSVGANADHFDVVLQLYLRLVEETDVGYDAESVDDTRVALCAVLDSLARVQLKADTYLSFLEDVHRRTLVNSASDVTQHPDVLASCLRVCSVAGASSRAVALFNRLCEPSSRTIAAEERNMMAALLSTPGAPSTLQRLLSFLHTKLPVTADTVHVAAARALMSSTERVSSCESASVFSFFDILELTVAAQHHVTAHTAASVSDRTFFLRVLAFLGGLHERRYDGSAECESLSAPEAAAVLRQWIASAARHQADRASWACALPPVTVGVLQELALELRRAAQTDGPSSSDVHPAAPGSPLLALVEEVLQEAAVGLPTSVRAIRSLDADALKGYDTLYCLPASLQCQPQPREWPLEKQRRFVDDAFRLLRCPDEGTSGEASCIRYQDWAVLHDLHLRKTRAIAYEPLADAWVNAESKRGKRTPASESTPSCTSRCVVSECPTVCVFTPLAEVHWWLLRDLDPPAHAPFMKVACLAESLGVVVPSVLGRPTHTWSKGAAVVESDARRRRTNAVTYWLQRWVDSVEAGRPGSLDSVFRLSVVRMLEHSASSVFAADASTDAAAQDEGSGTPPNSSEKPSTFFSPGSAPASVKRSGLETIFVHGPSSLVYRA
ncbi:hypothetical protein JKF63_07554 [Porcisia hertigi]|uniref:Uncharacterized protein n=1 Tax=Porcisia hertigi TaxID=2761500 RepID=A0A836LM64_9TRYP|nr:hypothetical protein JKF63_07554 [Porcisia hertigi]